MHSLDVVGRSEMVKQSIAIELKHGDFVEALNKQHHLFHNSVHMNKRIG